MIEPTIEPKERREAHVSNPSRWVLINRLAEITGYREDAVRHKVKNGT